jgi:hypothetical protein
MRTRACVLLPLAIAGCGGHAETRTPAAPTVKVGVALDVTPDTAIVELDDKSLGPAASLAPAIALEPGLHTLVVSQDDYHLYRAEFTVTDRIEHFVVRLVRLEPLEP